MRNKILSIIFAGFVAIGCNNPKKTQPQQQAAPAKVTIEKENGKFSLMVNGAPFYIKGAGLEFGDVAALAKHGGNAFRTWRVDNGQRSAKEILDEAQKNGLMVMMGIEVARERHGFDYNDSVAVRQQKERIRKEVTALKDHPALLLWGIGNELNLEYTNPKVWDAVNDLSKMIHAIDPNHLTTTSLAGITQENITLIKERCPDLDLLSVQLYGDLGELPTKIRQYGWEKAYIVTEWGATGYWEVPTTAWKAPVEEHSSVKAANYLKRYNEAIAKDTDQCVGSFVFLWGNKQERTPTWFGIFLEDGSETESVDVMHYLWNGKYPDNQSPKLQSFTLNGKTAYDNITLQAGTTCTAQANISDPDSDPLSIRWELLREATDLRSGGDVEARPEAVPITAMKGKGRHITFKAPSKGAYRLFVYGYDGKGHAATANIPFLIK